MSSDPSNLTDPALSEIEEALETDRFLVAGLERHRAWLSLKVHLRERRDNLEQRMTRAMFRRGAKPVDQREVDYARGVIDTIDWMLALPERMRKKEEANA